MMPINMPYQSFKENMEILKNPQRNSEAVIHSAKTPYRYTTSSIINRNNSSSKYEISNTNQERNSSIPKRYEKWIIRN